VDAKGRPLCLSILAPDKRAEREVRFITERIGENAFYIKTGLRANSYFSLPRMLWLKNHAPQVYDRTAKFLSTQDYLVFKLTGRTVTELSQASRTLCLNVHTRTWDTEILEKVEITEELLPELVEPGQPIALISRSISEDLQIPAVPVIAAGGDQMCASLGAGALRDGSVSVNHGTGSFLESPVLQPALDNQKRYLCSIHVVPGHWIIECPILVTGGLVEEQIRLLWGAEADPTMALVEVFRKPEANDPRMSPVFLPYQTIATAPHWRPGLTGVLWGLRSFHDRCDIVRSLLEGILFDLRRCMMTLPSIPEEIIVGGGLSSFAEFNQMQADILGLPVLSTEEVETTSLGAAILASVAVGLHGSGPVATEKMVRRADASRKFPIREHQEYYSELMRRQEAILDFALAEAIRNEDRPICNTN
jgi:sugar (pentulose or hexulose) kinase